MAAPDARSHKRFLALMWGDGSAGAPHLPGYLSSAARCAFCSCGDESGYFEKEFVSKLLTARLTGDFHVHHAELTSIWSSLWWCAEIANDHRWENSPWAQLQIHSDSKET